MTQPDSPPLLIILMPSSQTHFHAPAARQVVVADKNDERAKKCFPSQDECEDGTSCSGRGSCKLVGKNVKGDGDCWGCKCENGFAGVECQKTDYTM